MNTIFLVFCYQRQLLSFHLFLRQIGMIMNRHLQLLPSFSSGIIHLVPINVSEMTKVFSNNGENIWEQANTSVNNIHIKSIKMF